MMCRPPIIGSQSHHSFLFHTARVILFDVSITLVDERLAVQLQVQRAQLRMHGARYGLETLKGQIGNAHLIIIVSFTIHE